MRSLFRRKHLLMVKLHLFMDLKGNFQIFSKMKWQIWINQLTFWWWIAQSEVLLSGLTKATWTLSWAGPLEILTMTLIIKTWPEIWTSLLQGKRIKRRKFNKTLGEPKITSITQLRSWMLRQSLKGRIFPWMDKSLSTLLRAKSQPLEQPSVGSSNLKRCNFKWLSINSKTLIQASKRRKKKTRKKQPL